MEPAGFEARVGAPCRDVVASATPHALGNPALGHIPATQHPDHREGAAPLQDTRELCGMRTSETLPSP